MRQHRIAPLVGMLMVALLAGFGPVPPVSADEAALALPPTSDRAPVPVDHFPSRLHAFVWRNWSLVPVARIASTVQATEDQVRTLAASMGLPPEVDASPQWQSRGYITVLRRNWHLLPFDQLLHVLDMSEHELAFALREDDFLWVKLGHMKPACEEIRWHEPTEAERKRSAEIADLVRQHFGEADFEYDEPPFAFVSEFDSPVEVSPERVAAAYRRDAPPRYIYSYCGTFGDPLADTTVDPFPDGLLSRLAEKGVNGVWLHVVLRQISPPTETFPEFGEGYEARLARLKELSERAGRYGIRIYLYMNEPRTMPREFFQGREKLRGVDDGAFATMCTSTPEVRQWLTHSLAHVFRQVPELGGVFTISASENHTSCASHGRQGDCPRCRTRTAAEIIAEVNGAIAEGVHRGSREARVICWDWGWNGHGLADDHIALLPEDVALMSVSEWALPLERGGVETSIGEYSISAVGPGPRALHQWHVARERGLDVFAKLQVNNTWELSTVPYLPVANLVAEHLYRLSQQKIDGTMLSWSLGGYPSPNLLIVQRFLENPDATIDEVLDSVAVEVYGEEAAAEVRRGWKEMSEGFVELPVSPSYLYNGPQQVGPANLLYEQPTGYSSTMVGFPYDAVDAWRGPYPVDVFVSQFDALLSKWRSGIEHFEAAAEQSASAADVHRVAKAAYLHFASVADQTRFIAARDSGDRAGMIEALRREIETAKQMYPLASADSRLGYEPSNHYFYVPHDFMEKVICCEYLVERAGE